MAKLNSAGFSRTLVEMIHHLPAGQIPSPHAKMPALAIPTEGKCEKDSASAAHSNSHALEAHTSVSHLAQQVRCMNMVGDYNMLFLEIGCTADSELCGDVENGCPAVRITLQ